MDMDTPNEQIEEQKHEPVTEFANLEDLTPHTITVEVDFQGTIKLIEMRALTFFEYNRSLTEVPEPLPPPGYEIDPKTKRPILDYSSPVYTAARSDAEVERVFRRVAKAIIKPAIPGDSYEDQVKWVREHLSTSIARQLNQLIIAAAAQGEARIAHRAETFPSS